MNAKFKPYVIGIDPGKSTGVGVIRRASAGRKEEVLHWSTHDFHSVQTWLLQSFPVKEDVKLFIELPPQMMFENQAKAGAVKFDKGRDRIMAAVGGVRQEAKLLFEILDREGWDVELVPPVRETKWDARKFKLFTGSSMSANQHERDAVRLAKYYMDKRFKL